MPRKMHRASLDEDDKGILQLSSGFRDQPVIGDRNVKYQDGST